LTKKVRKQVTEELITMGKLRKEEKILIIVLISCLALWVTSTFTGLDSAMIGILIFFFFFFFWILFYIFHS